MINTQVKTLYKKRINHTDNRKTHTTAAYSCVFNIFFSVNNSRKILLVYHHFPRTTAFVIVFLIVNIHRMHYTVVSSLIKWVRIIQ